MKTRYGEKNLIKLALLNITYFITILRSAPTFVHDKAEGDIIADLTVHKNLRTAVSGGFMVLTMMVLLMAGYFQSIFGRLLGHLQASRL